MLPDEIGLRLPHSFNKQLANYHILLVDDCDINLEVAKRLLEAEGAAVSTACNGRTAVDFALSHSEDIDVILMDLQVPELDGYDTFRRIAAALGKVRPPVTALTAGASEFGEAARIVREMEGMITKPFELAELVRTIWHLARRSHQTIEVSDEQSSPTSWPTIEGIDTAHAQDRLNGDLGLYKAVLLRLVEDYADLPCTLSQSSPDVTRRRAHRLRGAAGLIGAVGVAEAAANVEMALLDRAPHIDKLICALIAKFETVSNSIVRVFGD